MRKVAVGATVILLHVAVVALIERGPRAPAPPPEPRAVVVGLGDTPTASPRASAPKPVAAAAVAPPVPTSPEPVASSETTPPTPSPSAPAATPSSQVGDASLANAAAGEGSGVKEDCDVAATLQARLALDAGARAALARIPTASRSVANAVMMWDGRWATPEAMGAATAGVNPIRDVVTRSLALTSPACVRAPVRGPRLLILDGPRGATVLAFGSGSWRWADVLESN